VVVLLSAEHANNTAVVDARDQDRQKVSYEQGLLLHVEGKRLIVAG